MVRARESAWICSGASSVSQRIHPKRPHVRVTDHALVRFLERAGGLDVEAIRHGIEVGMARSAIAAAAMGASHCTIVVDGLAYVLQPERDGEPNRYVLVTVKTNDQRRGKVSRP